MGTIFAGTLINKAAVLLQDTTFVRWPITELLGWLNDAQRDVVLYRPESSSSTTSLLLTPGTTKQNIPTDGVTFLRLTRNMGADGNTPGRAIRLVSREIMDAQNPNWHTDTASGRIDHYVYDPLDPKTFYVYPKAPAGAWKVELVYAKTPDTLTATVTNNVITASSTISVDDVYANALLDYTLFRAYSKDAEYAQNAQLAVAYYQSFANAVGISYTATQTRNPNVLDGGMNPNVPKR